MLVSREHLAVTGGRCGRGGRQQRQRQRGDRQPKGVPTRSACASSWPTGSVSKLMTSWCARPGLIGFRLPMGTIENGIPALVESRDGSLEAASLAATGMLTTDSGTKEVLVESSAFAVAGMAKGAAMLAPNMATMLAILTTDAAVEPAALGRDPADRGARLVQRDDRRRLHLHQRHGRAHGIGPGRPGRFEHGRRRGRRGL